MIPLHHILRDYKRAKRTYLATGCAHVDIEMEVLVTSMSIVTELEHTSVTIAQYVAVLGIEDLFIACIAVLEGHLGGSSRGVRGGGGGG